VDGSDLRGRAGPAGEVGLADTIAALRDEIRGLRSAARMRAVIEQAKGVLVERHRISLDEAFGRLRTMSQEHNVRLVEVAATVVGVAVPTGDEDLPADLPEDVLRGRIPASPAASRSWRSLQEQPEVRAGVMAALVDSVAGATSHGDEAAQLLADLLAPYEVAAVALYRTAADESLRLVGQHGIPGDVISPWRSIPPSRDIPYVAALLDRRTFLWGTREERLEDFPGLRGMTTRSGFEATGTIPVTDSGTALGVVGLMWDDAQVFDEERRTAIVRTVERVTPMLLRNVAAADPELDWLNTLLRLHLDPWLLLETVAGADGMIRDFVVQDAASTVEDGPAWVGRRLLELWPSLTQEGVSRALAGLARSGGSWTMTVATPSDAPWGIPGSRVRAVRLGRRIVVVWRPGRLADRRSGGSEPHQGEGGLAVQA
jgi:hypothetical protein